MLGAKNFRGVRMVQTCSVLCHHVECDGARTSRTAGGVRGAKKFNRSGWKWAYKHRLRVTYQIWRWSGNGGWYMSPQNYKIGQSCVVIYGYIYMYVLWSLWWNL